MFSRREGFVPSDKVAQINSIDGDLRNSLWSLLTQYYWDEFDQPKYDEMGITSGYIARSNLSGVFTGLWLNYFKEPTDTIPEQFYDSGGLHTLRRIYFGAEWYEVYDLIELIAEYGSRDSRESFIAACNEILIRESSGYRFVSEKIVPISSAEEVREVENAIQKSATYTGVKVHIEQAMMHLKDRLNPDYRNSIKESISAVESLCKEVIGDDKAKFGVALKELERRGVLHPSLKSAFSSLYGYTSDSSGIRHALLTEENLTAADARFMLVCCSAFTNLVIDSTTITKNEGNRAG